ncbi:MAG: leucyl/phenylalanyl-tRNA--protein transferase [Fimbriimonadaceae bacterium]
MNGSDLTTSILWYGYTQGAFPMTMDGGDVDWFQPRSRALLPVSGIRISKSLAKVIRQERFEIRFDTAFGDVMRGCLRPKDNWISEDFVRVYGQAHEEGWAHCVEAWHGGDLVGGVYGLALGKAFCAESMFHRETNASKVALHALVQHCQGLGFHFVDVQIMNPHLASLGAYEISHGDFMRRLSIALREQTDWSLPRRLA